jgi:hypothetical protein
MTDGKTDMTDPFIQNIASMLDYPSLYMSGPSRQSLKRAEKIADLLGKELAVLRAENARLRAELDRVPAAGRALHAHLEPARAYHPAELPEHLKDAIRDARMDPRHGPLNALLDEEDAPPR